MNASRKIVGARNMSIRARKTSATVAYGNTVPDAARKHRPILELMARRWMGSVPPTPQVYTRALQQRLMKTGGRLAKHARYYRLPLAESHLTRRLAGAMLCRIAALSPPAG
ncbi:MAG: hypothetical protein ACRD2O_08315 [Terriglobia bacterium]